MREFINIVEDADVLSGLYDEGNFVPTASERPIFSRQFWKALNHHCKSIEDKNKILKSKHFITNSNPVIFPGVYTIPDEWDKRGSSDTLIPIKTRQARFAHNGSDRPMDSLYGIGSVWWNKLYCEALGELGTKIQFSKVPEDYDWLKKNRSAIEKHIDLRTGDRVPFIKIMTRKLLEYKIDILGNGGEFIIMNPDVIWWEQIYRDLNYKSSYQKKKEKTEEALSAVSKIIRDFHIEHNSGTMSSMFLIHEIPSKRSIVFSDFYFKSNNLATEFLHIICTAADLHKVTLGIQKEAGKSRSKGWGVEIKAGTMDSAFKNFGFIEMGNFYVRKPN